MGRLRYMRNARTGDAGTVCVGDLTVTGDLTVEEGYTYGSETVSLNQNLQGTLTVGRENSGHDVKFWGVGSDKYWLWDASANKVDMKGAFDIAGNMDITGTLTTDAVVIAGTVSIDGEVTMATTNKIRFTDEHAYIHATSGGTMKIYAQTAIGLYGAVNVSSLFTTTAAIVTTYSGATALDIGAATTGIDITAATTGININGSSTTNIAISGATATGISLTGTYSLHGIAIGVYQSALDLDGYADRLLSIWGSSDATGGNVMPLYVSMVTTGADCLVRAAEFVLTPGAYQLGDYANAVKTYLDLTDSSGGSGLVASLCAEVLLPEEAMTGTITVLELELTSQSSFTSSGGVGVNCVSFITANLGGSNTGEIDEFGYFLNVQGLNDTSTYMLFENTLKCAIGTDTWYLPFSTAQSSYTTAFPISVTVTTGTALDIGAATTGIDISGALTTAILIDGASNGTSINIDRDMNFLDSGGIGDNYPAAIKIDLEQTADTGTGAWAAQGGMYGLNSRLHVAYANTGAYCVLGRAYITSTGSGDFVNDVVGVMGELLINGVDTRYGATTSSLSALRGDISNLSTGSWNGQVYTLFLNYGSGKNYGKETAFIHAYNHADSYLDYGIHLCQNSTAQALTAGIWLDIASSTTVTKGIFLENDGTLTTGIDIEGCATANIAISGTNATGIALTGTYSAAAISITETSLVTPGKGLYVNCVYQHVTGGLYNGIESRVEYEPTANAGYAWVNAIFGEVALGADDDFLNAQGGMFGIEGKVRFRDGAIVNQTSSVFGGLKGGIRITGTPVFTNFSSLCAVRADYMGDVDLAGMGQYGSALFAGFSSDSGTIDHGLYLSGGNKMTNVFRFDAMEGAIGVGAVTTGDELRIKINVEGDTFYMNAYSG